MAVLLAAALTAVAAKPRQVVIRFISEDPAAISAAVAAFNQAGIPFTMERPIPLPP